MDKKSRKGKALLLLPLLVVPFLTLAFWAGGGGKRSSGNTKTPSGLNMQLPNAHLKDDRDDNKLSFYEASERDAARLRQQVKNDPSFQQYLPADSVAATVRITAPPKKYAGERYADAKYTDPNEEKVYQKLAELNEQLNTPAKKDFGTGQTIKRNGVVHTEDVDRLEALMQMSNNPDRDPEMEQLSGMMEKILDIQHPERVQTHAKPTPEQLINREPSFDVNSDALLASVSLLDTMQKMDTIKKEEKDSIGFYGSDNGIYPASQNAIEAVVHEGRTLVNGAVIKFRLLQDITVNTAVIPKDNFVYGICSFSGERLKVAITSIRSGNSVYPVQMEVYDMDGMPGIYIPGAITRDAAKQSAGNGIQQAGITSVDPSVAAQATAAGINAAKNLFGKKIKVIKVFVKAGYRVLLHNRHVN